MKYRYKRKAIFALASLAALLLLQTAISRLINKSKDKILDYANATFGYRFGLEAVSFNLLRGLHIKGGSLTYNDDDKKIIFIKDAFISIKIPPLFFRALEIKIDINEASLFIKREGEGINTQVILSNIYKKMPKIRPKALGGFKNGMDISIGKTRIINGDNPHIDILLKDSKIRQKSQSLNALTSLEFDYHLAPDSYLSYLLSGNYIKQEIKCLVQGHINGDNLHLDYILLNIEGNEIIGMGLNQGFKEKNPYLYINFLNSMVLLDKLSFLKMNFRAKGNAYFTLGLAGRMDGLKINIRNEFSHCSFVIPGDSSFNIKELQGKIEYQDDLIKINNASLKINDVPLDISRLIYGVSSDPEIKLELSFPREFFDYNNLSLNKLKFMFEGRIKQFLSGNLEISALYQREGKNLNMQAYFNDIEISYRGKEKYLTVGDIRLIKNDEEIQKITFAGLKSRVYLDKAGINLENISVTGYGSSLSADVKINLVNPLSLNVMLKGRDLDLKSVMQDININGNLLSGKLDAQIAFDNLRQEFLKGKCHIKNGVIDLTMLGSIIGIPALKTTKFLKMDADFSITKQLVSLERLEMLSPEIMLGLAWNTNHKVSGELKLSVNSHFLKQYATFKKLLNITKIKKEYVDFSFLMAGTPKGNTRILWQKGEFKEKLKQNLPQWLQKRIEKELDKIVDNL